MKGVSSYLREISKISFMDKERERECLEKANAGDNCAKNQLICAMLPLVVSLAVRHSKCRMPLSDLIQEGNLALISAVEKFDLRYKNRFSTFAYKIIRQGMLRAIQRNRTAVRIPSHVHEKYKLLSAAYEESKNLNFSERIRLTSERTGMSEKTVRNVIMNNTFTVSFEKCHIALPEVNTPENLVCEKYYRKSVKYSLTRAMKILSQKESAVIRGVFGLNSEKKTLRQLGSELGLTHERVRQINRSALQKLSESFWITSLKQTV